MGKLRLSALGVQASFKVPRNNKWGVCVWWGVGGRAGEGKEGRRHNERREFALQPEWKGGVFSQGPLFAHLITLFCWLLQRNFITGSYNTKQ